MYIAIEGVDTAGKSTQLTRLKRWFPEALFIREPGETPVGKRIREIVLTEQLTPRGELLLFLADRAETIEQAVRPALSRGRLIFSDRSLLSGIGYSFPFFPLPQLLELNRFATGGLFPDLAILLKLGRGELERRLRLKEGDRIEGRGVEYLLQVQAGIEKGAEKLGIELVVIDGEKPVEKVEREILEELEKRFHLWSGVHRRGLFRNRKGEK
ncbi:MAG: dTMP kinase [Campylobacterales bacterium]